MQVVGSGTVTIPQNSITAIVRGGFVLPYEVVLQPNAAPPAGWPTETTVVEKTETGFTVVFNVPAPANATLDYVIVALAPEPIGFGSVTLAGDLITSVRDQVPEPVYDETTGLPLPDTNGSLFRASTLYRWLDEAVRIMARACGSIVEDWTALPQRFSQPWYAVDPKFINITAGFSNQWPLETVILVEPDTIWPGVRLTTSQSLWGYYRKRADHLEFGLWPVPHLTDPVTILTQPIPASGVDFIDLEAVTGFLSFGYVQIDQEIIQYQRRSQDPPGIRTLSRGVCGTTQAPHNLGAGVQHLGLWLKGQRAPGTICRSTSVVELPVDITPELTKYVLAKCRGAENEHGEARSLMQEFRHACAEIRADPNRKENMGQIRAFGDYRLGPLYWKHSTILP